MYANFFCLVLRSILHVFLSALCPRELTFFDGFYRLLYPLDSSCVQPLEGTGRRSEEEKRMNGDDYYQESLPMG